MTNLLKEMHSNEVFWLDHVVGPQHVPVIFLSTVLYSPVKFISYIRNNIIFGHCIRRICTTEVDNNLFEFWLNLEDRVEDRNLLDPLIFVDRGVA